MTSSDDRVRQLEATVAELEKKLTAAREELAAAKAKATASSSSETKTQTIQGTFKTQFGSTGKLPGQFNKPFLIAASADNLFVTDLKNYRFDTFSADGTFVRSVGKDFSATDGQFKEPKGVHVHKDLLFVADYNRRDVQVFEASTGKHVRTMGKVSGNPYGLCVVNETELWLCCNAQIIVVDVQTSEVIKVIGTTKAGSDATQFKGCCALCIVGNEVVVSDTDNDRLQVLSTQGKFLRTIGAAGQFSQPRGLAYHAGELFVVEDKNHRVSVVDVASGKTLRTFGKYGRGGGEGEFYSPCGAAVLQNKLFISDQGNDRVQVFV